MKKADAERLIPYIKTMFVATFSSAKEIVEETPIILISNRGRAEARQKAFDQTGARFKEDDDIRGEAIFGPEGRAVLIYTAVAAGDWDLCHTGWHELGHVMTKVINKELFIEAENDVNAMHDTPIRSGMALWSEFIAEYIALIVEDAEPENPAWPKQDILASLIHEATGTGSLNPYPLAFYCAMMMGDNTIEVMLRRQPNAAIGLDDCDDYTGELIVGLLNMLDKQLCQDIFWDIKRESLERIGAQMDELWSHCYYSPAAEILKKILKKKKSND